jgi:hypothetical protein
MGELGDLSFEVGDTLSGWKRIDEKKGKSERGFELS